uniref:helix-turn-helix domain-containing protein n=1 Tax=Streptomyces turgidiscabies TaxID=85558 RepID=UPI0027D8B145|nr:winged helix-turn-helix domain-containing protein [Streptomyces turgidiscabies]
MDAGPDQDADRQVVPQGLHGPGGAKLLKRHGWSCQVPVRHAIERDEEAIEMWKDEVWPRLKGQRRTWAPISASRTRQARG